MKRRLNILCVIVLLVLGYSVLETTYYVGLGIKTGIEKGFDSKIDAKAKEEISNVQVVQLVPKDLGGDILIDSVYNEKPVNMYLLLTGNDSQCEYTTQCFITDCFSPDSYFKLCCHCLGCSTFYPSYCVDQ